MLLVVHIEHNKHCNAYEHCEHTCVESGRSILHADCVMSGRKLYTNKSTEYKHLTLIAGTVSQCDIALSVLILFDKAVNSLAVDLDLPARLVRNGCYHYLSVLCIDLTCKVSLIALVKIKIPLVGLQLSDVLFKSFLIQIVEVEACVLSYHDVLIASDVLSAVALSLDGKSDLYLIALSKWTHSQDR